MRLFTPRHWSNLTVSLLLSSSVLAADIANADNRADALQDLHRMYQSGDDDAFLRLFVECEQAPAAICSSFSLEENLRELADSNHGDAAALIAIRQLSAPLSASDYAAAMADLERAIAAGSTAGMIAMADIIVAEFRADTMGISEHDLERARTLYDRASESGAVQGAFMLGVLDQLGIGLDFPDLPSAHMHFLDAADRGSAQALNALGLMALADLDDQQRFEKAAEFFRQARALGFEQSTHLLIDTLLAAPNAELNFFEASFLLEELAASGDIEAAYRWGTWLLEGQGVPRDIEAARVWLTRAAEQDHAEAAFALATTYRPMIRDFPSYPPTDIDQALHWLDLAMEANIAEAYYLAGQIHYRGDGGRERDFDKAEELFVTSRELGLPENFEARAEMMVNQSEAQRIAELRTPSVNPIIAYLVLFTLVANTNAGGGGGGGHEACQAVARGAAGNDTHCGYGFFSTGNSGADMLGYSLMMR